MSVEVGAEIVALGIDIGFSGVRAAVVRGDGTVLGRARSGIGHGRRMSVGRAEQDPEALIASISDATRRATIQADTTDVAVIGIGAFGCAPLLVDEHLVAISPALLPGLDRRGEAQRRRLVATTGVDDAQIATDHALPKLLWWREVQPALFERAAMAIDVTGFIVARLTGTAAMDEITALDYQLAGVDVPIALPKPCDPLDQVAGLTSEAADATGLPEGTPVTAGTYDSYVDLFAGASPDPG
ncbi:MAG: FGGY family carbohydrate kinase, partial [Solirubrobacteraceae bacterium]